MSGFIASIAAILRRWTRLGASSGPQTRTVQLDLLDSKDTVLSSTTDTATIGLEQMEAVVARSVMLPMTPGVYRLRAQIIDAANVPIDSASLALRIR